VSGATTGAENLVPRSEFYKYRLVYDLNIQKEMPHYGWSVQAVPYDIDRSRQVAKGGFSRVAYFVETVSTNGGPFDHRLGPDQDHLRRHDDDLPMRGLEARNSIECRFRARFTDLIFGHEITLNLDFVPEIWYPVCKTLLGRPDYVCRQNGCFE
jgi:hypothetical protein